MTLPNGYDVARAMHRLGEHWLNVKNGVVYYRGRAVGRVSGTQARKLKKLGVLVVWQDDDGDGT